MNKFAKDGTAPDAFQPSLAKLYGICISIQVLKKHCESESYDITSMNLAA